jgi:hypothetical protein
MESVATDKQIIESLSVLLKWPLLADGVEKVFLGSRTKVF